MKKPSSTAMLAMLTTVVIWASAFIAIREGVREYHAGSFALLRLLVGATCMTLLYAIKAPKHFISFKDKLIAMLLGAIGTGAYHVFLNLGEKTVTAGIASFIIAQAPILIALFSVIFLREKIHKLGWIGLFISILGIAIIAEAELRQATLDLGVFYILISTVTNCIYVMNVKNLLLRMGTLYMTTFVMIGGAISTMFFLPDLIKDLNTASKTATYAAIYLGIFPTAVAYLTYNYALSHMTRTTAVSWIYAMPLITILMGWLWLGELPTSIAFIGGLLALSGTILVNYAARLKNKEPSYSKRVI